jgi:hypothetical protein
MQLLIDLILLCKRFVPVAWITWAIITDVKLWEEKQQRQKE